MSPEITERQRKIIKLCVADGISLEAIAACLSIDLEAVKMCALTAGMGARQIQVYRMWAQCKSRKDIAFKLGIAPKTVGWTVDAVYRKTGTRSRLALALYAMRTGFIPVPWKEPSK